VAATSDGSSTIQRTYNAIGAQTSYQDADNVTSTVLAFDALGRPTWTSDGKGAQQVTYDDAGHVTTMIDTQVGAFNAGYNADGQLTGETMPNGLTLANGYDSTGNPTSRTYMNGSGEVMQFIEDSSIHGQVTRSVTEVGGAVSATDLESYDAAGRLKQSLDSTPSGGCSTENYTYDGDSNRTQQRSVAAIPGGSCDIDPNHGALRGHSYDEADRLIDTGYTYDAFGRSTAVPASDAGGDALTVDYYVDDVVRSMTQGSVTKTFLVDPGGRTRVTQTPGQTDEVSHFSDDSDALSWTAQGTDWERYVAGIDGGLCAVQQGSGSNLGALSWQVTNIHGDTRGEVDGQGQLTTTFTTDEFGVPTGSVPSSGYGFLGGKQRKSQFASGVITMGQRVYVPQIGRFLQVDPVAGGSANDYDYANQDPVNNFDLTGETVYYAPHPGRGLICGFGGCKKRRPHRVVGVNIPGKLNCKTCSKVVITKKKCTADPQIAKTADEGYSPSYNDPATVECHYKATLFVPKFAAPRGLGNSIKVRKISLRFTCTEPIEINPDVPYEPLIPAGVTGDKCYGTTRRRLGSFYADKQAAVSGVAWY
jgi:RHS repeat-associated protein